MSDSLSISNCAKVARGLFPAEISVAATDPRREYEGLMAEEVKAIVRATPRRRREFVAGRVAARHAMSALGYGHNSVPSGSDRAPVWPPGLVGSISHTGSVCMSVVARSSTASAIGIDVETDEPLSQDLWDTVLTSSDQSMLRSFPRADRGRIAKIIFSAKECVYKCQYPISKKLFGFDMLNITLDMEGYRFWATLNDDVAPFSRGTSFAGNFALTDNVVITGMTLAPLAEARTAKNTMIYV
ncbi:4'-phosphopantetheinyl transferase family protein [Algicella marina]|nr:4'-phosphopantetheinyl transferase superfamily protein [Algicella marina]